MLDVVGLSHQQRTVSDQERRQAVGALHAGLGDDLRGVDGAVLVIVEGFREDYGDVAELLPGTARSPTNVAPKTSSAG